jgi:hypothetical protein
MRSRIAKRLPPDADKLVGLSLALFASGSRTEDRFWEAKLDALLTKIVRNANQTTLDAALDHLQQNHPDAYGALADMAETHSESFIIEHEGITYEALLIAAPVLAWTRYAIPSGPLKNDSADALRAHLQAHVLAAGTRVALAPFLYSIDQLPRHHVETWRIAQQLTQAALGAGAVKINFGELPETSPILADPRRYFAGRKRSTATASSAVNVSSNGLRKGVPICRWRFRVANSSVCCRTPTIRLAATQTNACVRIPCAPPCAICSTPSARRQPICERWSRASASVGSTNIASASPAAAAMM